MSLFGNINNDDKNKSSGLSTGFFGNITNEDKSKPTGFSTNGIFDKKTENNSSAMNTPTFNFNKAEDNKTSETLTKIHLYLLEM